MKNKYVNLTICFKSGNKLTFDKITKWEVGCDKNCDINRLSITQNVISCKKRLIVNSLSLSSIECIFEH